MFNQFVFSPEEQLSITQETLFKPEKPFLWPIRFQSFVTMKRNQLSEFACLINLTISVNAGLMLVKKWIAQNIKSKFFPLLKTVPY